MSDFVAFDWEKNRLCGLEAQVTRGRVEVRRAFQLSWPEELDPLDDPETAGRWLTEELQRVGVRARQALIAIPREDVVVRQLQLPDVPDEELPDLVYLQAETKTSSSLDRLALDYLPLPTVSDEGRHVLLVTFPRERLQALQRTVTAAGLELASVGIVPAAAAELVARAQRRVGENPDEACLVVTPYGHRVEIVVMRNRHVLLAHAAQLGGGNQDEVSHLILAEIRRSQGALMRLDPNVTVRHAWLIGSKNETESLGRLLTERLGCATQTVDPIADSAVRFRAEQPSGGTADFVGPVGLLLAQTGSIVQTVDFLDPRRSVVRPDRRRVRLLAAAAGITLVVGAVYGGVRWRAAGLDRQIDQQQRHINEMDQTITLITKREGPVVKHAQTVREWEQQSIDLLQQLQELQRAVESTERLYLVDLRISSTSAGRRILGTGHARSRLEAEQLSDRLALAGYVVNPKEISRSSPDSDYPYRFDLEVEIPVASKEK